MAKLSYSLIFIHIQNIIDVHSSGVLNLLHPSLEFELNHFEFFNFSKIIQLIFLRVDLGNLADVLNLFFLIDSIIELKIWNLSALSVLLP